MPDCCNQEMGGSYANRESAPTFGNSDAHKDGRVKYFFRAECGVEDRFSKVYGPFNNFLQLTYNDLRCGPNGDIIAQFTAEGFWYIIGAPASRWSDIVIWADTLREDGCPERIANLLESEGWSYLPGRGWYNPAYFSEGTTASWKGAKAWAKLEE